ncbi:MAG: hypothetical protein IK002_02865 [Treponema sp.]|nr:hypothetical protein [Treponema sp.]
MQLVIILLFLVNTSVSDAYMVKFKEDYYKLYHVNYKQNPNDCIENIYWLEKAVKADFCNPLYAKAKITNETQYEKYRYLFMMHLNLKLIEQHVRLGRNYDKKAFYFYDCPWKEEYLSNLKKTKAAYEAGYYYWKEACLWAEKANVTKFKFLFITELQNWEDERERIATGELNYKTMLDRELKRVNSIIAEIEEIDRIYESQKANVENVQ